ncbi:MAG: sensor histidine kinase [Rhodothermaceae bacterium]
MELRQHIKNKKVWILVISGCLIYLLYFLFLVSHLAKGDINLPNITRDFLINSTLMISSIPFIYLIIKYLNLKFTGNLIKRLLIELGAVIIISFLFSAIAKLLFWQSKDFFVSLEKAFWDGTIAASAFIVCFLFVAFETFYQVNKNQLLQLKFEQIEKENILLQYHQLKSQMNPHFLFNSLNILTVLTRENQENAISFINKLSEVYRYVLVHDQKKTILLQREVEFINNFIEILLLRYSAGLQVNIDIRKEDLQKEIIPMTLQLLVENAIKHNVVSLKTPLTIDIYSEKRTIVVKNNFNPKSSIIKSSKIGLKNIKRRYDLLNKSKVNIQKGQHFTVRIPLI